MKVVRFLSISFCCCLSVLLLSGILTGNPPNSSGISADVNVSQSFSQEVDSHLFTVLDGIVPSGQTHTYQLNDHTLVAPKSNPECFGQVSSPSEMEGILLAANSLLAGQESFFTPEIPVWEGQPIRYYLDDTLFTVTWKQPVDKGVYTFAEVKIAHASQFRRFFSEGRYNSSIFLTPTDLSRSVNAVLASSGDFFGYREIGVVVNNGQVFRGKGHFLDTCYIDDRGNLLFTMAGDITSVEDAQKFVDENNVRFSLSFGPLIIKDGVCCVPEKYNSGEINGYYVRAALCQLGPLHYLVVTAHTEEPYYSLPKVSQFAERLQEMGIETAYCLDGGQTAAIILDHELVNHISYGAEREVSDIIYFATALPEESWEESN